MVATLPDDDWAPRAAAARRPRRRRRDRRRRLHRAVDGVLPGAGRPVAAHRRARARDRRLRRVAAATAAGARRCSRRRWPKLARRLRRASAAVAHAARDAATPSTRSAGSSPAEGIDVRLGQGRHRRRWPARRPSSSGPGPRSARRARWGFGEDDLRAARRRRGRRAAAGATDVLGGDVHPALRGDPPGPAGARARPGGRARGASRSTRAPRSPRIEPGVVAHRRTASVRAPVVVRATEGYTRAAARAASATSRRSTR